MLPTLLHSPRIAEYLNLAEFSYRNDISNRRLPSGQGPSFVKNYRVDPASFLKLVPSLDQDPVLSALARPNQEGCWSGDSERARTRDNHNVDKGEEGKREANSCDKLPGQTPLCGGPYARLDKRSGESA